MGRKLEPYSSLIVELDKQIDEKSSLIIETEKKIEDTRKQFLGRMASMYEDGNASYLEVILGAKDISDFHAKYGREKTLNLIERAWRTLKK